MPPIDRNLEAVDELCPDCGAQLEEDISTGKLWCRDCGSAKVPPDDEDPGDGSDGWRLDRDDT